MKIGSGLNRHIFLQFMILVYLAQLMLPIVFNNLIFPFNSAYFYSAALLATFLFLYPKSLLNRDLKWFYIFIALQMVFRLTVWKNREQKYGFDFSIKSLLIAYYPVYISLIVFWHYMQKREFEILGALCRNTLIMAAITIVNNYFVFLRYPRAMNVSSGLERQGSAQVASNLQKIGFAGYGFFNALTSHIPAIVYHLRSKTAKHAKKIGWATLLFVLLVTLPRTNTTTFVLFALIFGIGGMFLGSNYKRDIYRILAVIIVVSVIPKPFIANIFYKSSEYFPNSKIGLRLYDAGITIENPYIDYYQSTEHTGRRLGRIPLLVRSFAENPFTGGGFHTGHVAWFDMLSVYGLVGFLPWFLFLYHNSKRTMIFLPNSFKPFYLLSITSFIAMGFLKNTGGSLVWTFWFLILPSTAFIASAGKTKRLESLSK